MSRRPVHSTTGTLSTPSGPTSSNARTSLCVFHAERAPLSAGASPRRDTTRVRVSATGWRPVPIYPIYHCTSSIAPHFYRIRTGKMGISVTALQSDVRCNLLALGCVSSVHVPRQRMFHFPGSEALPQYSTLHHLYLNNHSFIMVAACAFTFIFVRDSVSFRRNAP
ncbi:hypothetical protein BC826DRAFT_484450 [Russula brevipes]|nr:hypothetical protein BC826DRAFT_484450 [Russula brevipes]